MKRDPVENPFTGPTFEDEACGVACILQTFNGPYMWLAEKSISLYFYNIFVYIFKLYFHIASIIHHYMFNCPTRLTVAALCCTSWSKGKAAGFEVSWRHWTCDANGWIAIAVPCVLAELGRTCGWSSRTRASSPWRMEDLIPTAPSSSSLRPRRHWNTGYPHSSLKGWRRK